MGSNLPPENLRISRNSFSAARTAFEDIYGPTNYSRRIQKEAELYILLSFSALDENSSSLKDSFSRNWSIFIENDSPLLEEDWNKIRVFLDIHNLVSLQRLESAFTNRSRIQSDSDCVNSFLVYELLWFFIYIGRYHGSYDPTSVKSQLESLSYDVANSLKNSFLYSDIKLLKNTLLNLFKSFWSPSAPTGIGTSISSSVGNMIAKQYLKKLESFFIAHRNVLSSFENGKFSNYLLLFPNEPRESDVQRAQVSANTAIPSSIKTPQNLNPVIRNSERSNTPPRITPESREESSNPERKETLFRKSSPLHRHEEAPPSESIAALFDEKIGALYDLSRCAEETFKAEGIERLIKTLNSSAYGNLLDQVFFAVKNKSKKATAFYSVAIRLKNAMAEHGFEYAFYPGEELGTYIGAPIENDREYLTRNYRWED